MTRDFIPYSCQSIDEDDIQAVVDCLRSDYLTTGPHVKDFEQKVADYCGAKYAIAVASGTAALHLSCHALGIDDDSLLWTSSNSFAASANCARYLGAAVDFVDIDRSTGNMSLDALEAKLRDANPLPDAVIPVHFSGHAVEMQRLEALAYEYGFSIIEDGAHALGASYTNGKKIGSSNMSKAKIFSFHPVKPVTTGEGGIIVTEDPGFAAHCEVLRSHGISRDPNHMSQNDGPWYYEMLELGYHYRMTDIQAALGNSQMNRLDAFIAHRRKMAKRYQQLLCDLPLILPPDLPHSGWHLFVIQLHDASKRKAVFEGLRAAKIGANVHYIPIHLHPYYRDLGFKPGDCPEAEAYYASAISLPLHQRLSEEDQDYICETLRQLLL